MIIIIIFRSIRRCYNFGSNHSQIGEIFPLRHVFNIIDALVYVSHILGTSKGNNIGT